MSKNRIKKAVEKVNEFLGKEVATKTKIPDDINPFPVEQIVPVELLVEQEQVEEVTQETPKEEIVIPQKEQKRVSAIESEQLQKEGWKVVSMTKEDGKRIHILEKV